MKPKMTAIDASRLLGVTVQAVHKQLRTKKLEFKKSQNRVHFSHGTARALFNLPFQQQTVAAQIVKGGTGKTSLLYSIAVRANLYGARVLCIDMDQQSNLTQALAVDPEDKPCMVDVLNDDIPIQEAIVNVDDGLDLLPSRIENAVLDNVLMLNRFPLDRVYRERFASLKQSYDLILIDCPPALGQSVAAVALAVDWVLAPVTPEKFSLSGLRVTTKELASLEKSYKCKIPIQVAINKFDARTVLSHEVLSTLMKHEMYGDMLLRTYVRQTQEFSNAVAKRQTVFDTLRQTSAKEDIDLLAQELLGIGTFAESKRKAS